MATGGTELWRECASWLTRCGLLRPDHKANWPQSTIQDLAYTLRDGVLLCNLLNVIEPGSVDMKDVNQRPQMAQFLCLRNIRVFLQACHERLQVREVDLFDPSMLFELSNFHRVLCTLATLSQCQKACAKNIQSFSAHCSQSHEDIYKDLQSIDSGEDDTTALLPIEEDTSGSGTGGGSSGHTTDDSPWLHFKIPNPPPSEERVEAIYEDLCYVRVPAIRPENFLTHEEDVADYGSYCARIRDEEVYQDLCAVKAAAPSPSASPHPNSKSRLRNVHQRESAASTSDIVNFSSRDGGGLPPLATASHSLEKRDYVIRELVDTESNYVDVLNKIEKYFLNPLCPFMKPQDFQVIFYGVKELREIHSGFLVLLRQATNVAGSPDAPLALNGPLPRLGEAFLTWREKFLVYGDYCSNLTNAQNSLKTLTHRDDIFSGKLTKCQKEHSDGRIQLRDILSVPMQRILKYHLLLEKLVQETQPNHEDFRSLERAKEAMVDVAQYINEVKRDSEVLVLLSKVQESIQDWELPAGARLADYGRLLLDGELRVKAHEDQKIRSRYVFVFDKVMVLCKVVRENQYSFRSVLRLCEWRVEMENSGRRNEGVGRWSARWYLVRRMRDGALTLYARTDDARRRWIAAVGEALDNMEPAGCRSTDHKFILNTFEKPASCHHCSKFLKGRIFQGYLCTVCGSKVHKACIVLSGRCGIPPPAPPHLPPVLTPPPDQTLHYYMWFVGEMGREMATSRLEGRVDGTFLLRVRPQPTHGPHDTHYALSLKTDNTVKHMRLCRRAIDGHQHYFLSESRYFRSVVELVSYYEKTSLQENFVGLDVVLLLPFRRVVAIATHEFNPSDGTQLALHRGDKILVLSKEGDNRGWWKGRPLNKQSDFQSGYFPKDCVRVDPGCLGNLD